MHTKENISETKCIWEHPIYYFHRRYIGFAPLSGCGGFPLNWNNRILMTFLVLCLTPSILLQSFGLFYGLICELSLAKYVNNKHLSES